MILLQYPIMNIYVKKSESSHSSKCIENSSALKAKNLKLENIFPPSGSRWSENLNNIAHIRNTTFKMLDQYMYFMTALLKPISS